MPETRLRSRLYLFVCALLAFAQSAAVSAEPTKRALLVTVDDLPMAARQLHDGPDARRRITRAMLDALTLHHIRAVGLVTWGNVRDEHDLELLRMWLEAGHELGNHSAGHLNFTATDLETYRADIEEGRARLAEFLADYNAEKPSAKAAKPLRFFRFPMLREGDTADKLEAMRTYLADSGQRNLPVTLDNQDWSFERPWVAAHRAGDEAAKARIADEYHEALHLSIRYHERRGDRLFDRPLPQILLLHAGEVGAAQWNQLFGWLLQRGYRFSDADQVLADPAFAEEHAYVGDKGPGLWDRLWHRRQVEAAEHELAEVLTEQEAAWNRGDLERFCSFYDEDTVFISPNGHSRGRQQVLERYRSRYPDRPAQGQLTLEALQTEPTSGTEISMLGDARPGRVHTATVVGRWTLSYPDQPDKANATGLTLLVFERRPSGWKIVRDASM